MRKTENAGGKEEAEKRKMMYLRMHAGRVMRLIAAYLLPVSICLCAQTAPVSEAEESYHWLAVGNSITCHSRTDFWPAERGMAASADDRDWVHLVLAYIRKTVSVPADYDFFAGENWEADKDSRERTIAELKAQLHQKTYQLITLQYGENLRTDAGFRKDFSKIIEVCQRCQPSESMIDGCRRQETVPLR